LSDSSDTFSSHDPERAVSYVSCVLQIIDAAQLALKKCSISDEEASQVCQI